MAGHRPITIEDPRGSLAVIFFEATTREDRIRGSKLANTAFGKSLSEESYLEREDYLADLPLARGTGWRWFSLALADNPEHVVAMCKTLHRDLLIRDSAGMRQEQGYCICSVITDSRYRGRGLATVLMKNIAEWLDGPGGAAASTLYSDVGDYYVNRGWDMCDAFQSTITVPPTPPSRDQRAKLPETRILTVDDLPHLCERDVESIKEDFQNHDLAPGTTLVTALPIANMVNWQQKRICFMNAKLLGKTAESKGSICESADAWMYWYHDLHHRKLIIQRAKLPKDQSDDVATEVLAQLLLDALEEAAKWDIQTMTIWNPGPELHRGMTLLSEEFGIDVLNEKREVANIPCIRWRGGEKKPTILQPNEFYSWC
ncbi:hypothetical protein K449DRAFT_368884 [Hypoxylon sp. EC38]|nr:hypothetical protein K449DRAFT_368884 [Hypoxylon sp. EC38]